MKKKEKEELEKKDKVSDMMTKDTVKKEDEKEEEKPDMRSKYAMINLIKNKLRSAGQRDPVVMAVDACEERTPAKDDPSFSQEYKDNAKKAIEASKKKGHGLKNPIGHGLKNPIGHGLKDPKGHGLKNPIGHGLKDPKGEKYNPYPKAPKGKKQATPENMAPGKP